MFSPIFSKGTFSLRKRAPLFTALLLFTLGTLLLGCPGEPDPASLVATWENVYHDPNGTYPDFTTTINITSGTVIYTGSYEAEIANEPDFEASYGVLILKFTKYANWGETPSTTHANVGKYGAMYWKDLTDSSVSLADAYTSGAHTMTDTLTAAKAAFTNDKAGDYIDWALTSSYNRK